MKEQLINNILEFREFIIVSSIVIVLFAMIVPLLIRRFDYRHGKQPFLFLLYSLDKKGSLVVAISLIEFLFIACAIMFQKEITFAYGMLFLVVSIVIGICMKSVKRTIMEVLNGVVLFLSLILGNVMFRYLQEIQFDISVLVIYIVLNIFILFYSVYVCLQHMMNLKKG